MRPARVWFWTLFIALQVPLLIKFIRFSTPAYDPTGYGATLGAIAALAVWVTADVTFLAVYGVYRFIRHIRQLRRLDAAQRESDARIAQPLASSSPNASAIDGAVAASPSGGPPRTSL